MFWKRLERHCNSSGDGIRKSTGGGTEKQIRPPPRALWASELSVRTLWILKALSASERILTPWQPKENSPLLLGATTSGQRKSQVFRKCDPWFFIFFSGTHGQRKIGFAKQHDDWTRNATGRFYGKTNRLTKRVIQAVKKSGWNHVPTPFIQVWPLRYIYRCKF